MYSSLCILPLISAALINADSTPLLLRRQTQVPCSELGQKTCGDGCIDMTDTCCPSGAGGCPLLTYCSLGSNGEYGCCDVGNTCIGDGGVDTSLTVITSTATILVPDETTVRAESTSSLASAEVITPVTSTLTLVSETLASVSSPSVLLSSRSSTPSSGITTASATTTSSLPEFSGGADSRVKGLSGWLLAIALPFLAV